MTENDASPTVERFIHNLRIKSKELGMTQDDLAKKAGISRGYLSGLFNGHVPRPGLDVAVNLATAVNSSVDKMLAEKLVCTHPSLKVQDGTAVCGACGAKLVVSIQEAA